MASTLVVEDGSLITGANSYINLTDARAYVAARGATLSAVDATADAVVIKAMDYLESFSARFKGELVERDQALSWPRTGVNIESWYWSYTEIPRQVITALCALIFEINAGEDPLNPSMATLPTIRKRVEGAVEIEYANPGPVMKVAKTQPSRTIINLLLKNSGLVAVRT